MIAFLKGQTIFTCHMQVWAQVDWWHGGLCCEKWWRVCLGLQKLWRRCTERFSCPRFAQVPFLLLQIWIQNIFFLPRGAGALLSGVLDRQVLSARSTSDGDKQQLTIQSFSKKFHPGETLTGSCAACLWPSVSVSPGLRPASLWLPRQAASPPPLAACSSPSHSLLTLVGATQVPAPPRCWTSAAANPSPAVQARGWRTGRHRRGRRRSCDVCRQSTLSTHHQKQNKWR